MRENNMAKPFKQLRDKMSPEAQKTASKKANKMLSEMSWQTKNSSGPKIISSDSTNNDDQDI